MASAHARNSNYLLNVGPDRKGEIIESSVKALAEIGKLRKLKATQEDTE
jgi:alpha-L-fucosidase